MYGQEFGHYAAAGGQEMSKYHAEGGEADRARIEGRARMAGFRR